MVFRTFSLTWLLASLLVSIGASGATVRVAAASSLRPMLEEMARTFRKRHPATVIQTVYGASGTLCAQILHGGPWDVFLSADAKHVRELARHGRLRDQHTFARGELVLVAPGASPEGWGVLQSAKVRALAIANPAHASYGAAAEQALRRAGQWGKLSPKLVYGETVEQALQFLQAGAAQAALVSRSLLSRTSFKDADVWSVPASLYDPLEQRAVLLTRNAEAESFLRMLLSAGLRPLLRRHGLAPTGDT